MLAPTMVSTFALCRIYVSSMMASLIVQLTKVCIPFFLDKSMQQQDVASKYRYIPGKGRLNVWW